MLSRRKFVGILSGVVAAPIVIKSAVLMPLRGIVLPDKEKIRIESPWENYQRFLNTPYLERMDFGNDLYPCDPNYINRQVIQFKEQEPIIYDFSRPIKSVRDCWLEAVAEVNAKHRIRS